MFLPASRWNRLRRARQRASSAKQSISAADSREEKELDSLRDRLNADEAKMSDNLGTTARTVATGLVLIVFTFATAKEPSAFVSTHYNSMKWAAICGLAALVMDAFQYLSALQQIRCVRIKIKHLGQELTVKDVVNARKNFFFHARNSLFYGKVVASGIGVIFVLWALLNSEAPRQNPTTLWPDINAIILSIFGRPL